jgi:hypothetical protein
VAKLKERLLSSLFVLALLMAGAFLGQALWHPPAFAQQAAQRQQQRQGMPAGGGPMMQSVSVGNLGNDEGAVIAYGNGTVALVWPFGIRTYRVNENGQVLKLDARGIDTATGDLTAPSEPIPGVHPVPGIQAPPPVPANPAP